MQTLISKMKTVNMILLGSLICSSYILSGVHGLYVKPGTISGDTQCNIATPPLDGNGDEFTVLLDHETAEQIPASTGVWVGYVRDYVVIQITGCLKLSDIPRGSVASITRIRNPFYCATWCDKYAHFGLTVLNNSSVMCTCIQYDLTNVNKTRHGCGSACLPSRNFSISCGNQGLLSVYEKVSGNMSTDESLCYGSDCDCLVYSNFILTAAFYWVPCAMLFKPACESGAMSNIVQAPWDLMNWTTAAEECFKYNFHLFSYQHSKRNKQQGQWWTGVIRGKTIYQIQDRNALSLTVENGYLEREGNTFYLKFTNDTSSFSRSLCNGNIQAPTTESHTIPYSEVLTTPPTLSSMQCTEGECHSAEKGGSENANSRNRQVDDPGSSVGVYAGVSVALVIVVGVLIGGLCFWKRRHSDPASHKERDDRHSQRDTADTYTYINTTVGNITGTEDTHTYINTTVGNITGTEDPTDPHYSDLDTSAVDPPYSTLRTWQTN